MSAAVLLCVLVVGAFAEDPNPERVHWPGKENWRGTWRLEHMELGVRPPTPEEWEAIGVFYTYDQKYMLQMRKVAKELQYRIHFHVDKHADDDLMSEMKILSDHGYARVFGPRYDRALEYISEATANRWKTWDQLKECSHNRDCMHAWTPDPQLMDQNATIVNILHAIPAEMTIRCHDHDNGLWCHNRVSEFNEGFFYIAEVRPDNDPDSLRIAAIMCHDWPETMLNETTLNPPHCHSTPVDGVVILVNPSLWDQVKLPSALHLYAPDGKPDPFLAAPGSEVPTSAEWHSIGMFYTYDEKYKLMVDSVDNHIRYRIHFHVDKHADMDLMSEMKILSRYGYARLFGVDYTGALSYIQEAAGRNWGLWTDLETCSRQRDCQGSWTPDPALYDQNATIVNVLHAVPAELTIRCHNHVQGLWCHNRVSEFNEGFFYVVEVIPDNEPNTTRIAAVMCHDWPEDLTTLTNLNPPHCHSTPVDGVVVIVHNELWDKVKLPSAKESMAEMSNATAAATHQRSLETEKVRAKQKNLNGIDNYVRITWPGIDDWKSTWPKGL